MLIIFIDKKIYIIDKIHYLTFIIVLKLQIFNTIIYK